MPTITEAPALRMKLWHGLLEADETVTGPDEVRQHELYCVRRGVAERVAREAGEEVANKRSALYFLRGMSAEALLKKGEGKRAVFEGVTCSTDWWIGGAWNFYEIKSTMLSSSHMWKSVKSGNIDLDKPHKMHSWIRQCGTYCICFGVGRCLLAVFFLHGDYADRRTKCPECGVRDMEDGRLYKRCRQCNYKSYYIDLRVYELVFAPEELEAVYQDVWKTRVPAFFDGWNHWQRNHEVAYVAERVPATPGFACWDCKAGKFVGCEYYGEAYGDA